MPLLKKLQQKPQFILWVTILLTSPALFSGWLGDDYIHYALLHPDLNIPKPNDWSLFGLFSWIDNDQQRTAKLMDLGVLPWWTAPEFQFQFWRPLAELSHWLDHRLWPNHPLMMHLHSLLWYLLIGWGLLRLYRQLAMGGLAVVAAVAVFLWDSSHGLTLSWIANRNALMATLFSVFCLYCYVRWRTEARPGWLAGSLLALLASLFSGEMGVGTCAFLGAYGLTLDRGGPRKGLLALWPLAVLSLLWLLLYKWGGFGASHFDANYIDPLDSPGLFLSKIAERAPILLFAQFGLISADLPTITAMPLGAYALVSSIFLFVLGLVFYPLLKTSALARFWGLGTLLATLPVSATVPADRNLILLGIGASALLGLLFQSVATQAIQSRWVRVGAKVLLILHLLIAPLLMPLFSYSPKWWSRLMALPLTQSMPIEAGEEVMLLGISMPIALAATPMRFANGLPIPDKLWLLSSDKFHFRVTRLAENNIELESSLGLINQFEQGVRSLQQQPLAVGSQVNTASMRVEVLEVDEKAHPLRLRLTFASDSTADRYVIYRKNQQFIKAALPNVGEALEIDLKQPK